MTRVSPEFARAFNLFRRSPDRWFSSEEIASQAAVSNRTARLVTRTLSKSGLIEVMKLSPSFRYRAKLTPCEGNGQLLDMLEAACEVLEIS